MHLGAAVLLLIAQSSGLDRDECVRLERTAAALATDGRSWLVPVRFCVFEPEAGDPLRAAALEPLRTLLAVRDGTAEAERFTARARLFLVDHERREHVNLAIGDLRFQLGPTGSDGCFATTLEVAVDVAAKLAPDGRLALAIGVEGDPACVRTDVRLVPPTGLSIVSDVDDTLKVTGVGDRREVLANTFIREFRAVPGMAELYARLAERGAAFHYVSLSPRQLAPSLEEFFASAGFPAGPLELQPFRLQDGDLADLTGDSRAKKLAAIEPLLAAWPQRRFVLVGDSGQLDPEVYGELARRHPEQVVAIWIRDLTASVVTASADGAAAVTRRFDAAFTGVEPRRCQRFIDPAKVVLPAEH